ncbi:MAG: replicative DNA helicase [Candidatus Melainabacteria bacterium GWF2_37_15]|nr:MAG: replicative DNA helicase [Candidatus Melainabacteria bacterium GWF2_37_15]
MENTTTKEKIYRLPPQNIEAEQAVLGALLIDPAAILRVSDNLVSNNFYKLAHKHIYEVMLQLFNNNEPIDIITVSESLNKAEKLELVGGRAYINDLALSVITSANMEYHAKIVSAKALLRELISAGSEIASLAYEVEDMDPEKAIDAAEQLVFNISQRKNPDKISALGEIVLDSYNQIEKRCENKGEYTGVPSGFYDLDDLTAGFQKSDLIIVAARPSMGKTSFCLNIAQEIGIKQQKTVAFFSLEMSKEQLVQRMLCSEAEVDAQRVRVGNLEQKDWEKLGVVLGKMGDAPIFIDDSPGISVMDVRTKCRKLCMEQKDLGLIIIDYLQLMEGSDRRKQDRVQEISSISRGLKNLARELKVPIIALSQLSRAVESRQSKIPMLSDLRESGSIEQDADIVMFIYRDEYYNPDNLDKKGKAEIIIAKQRNGPTGSVELLFQNNITRFKNPARNKTNLF